MKKIEKDILNGVQKKISQNNENSQSNEDSQTNSELQLTEEDKIKQSEPLHSIYSKDSGLLIEDLIKEDNLFIKDFIRKIDNKEFIFIDNNLIKEINFKNINRIEDLD